MHFLTSIILAISAFAILALGLASVLRGLLERGPADAPSTAEPGHRNQHDVSSARNAATENYSSPDSAI
jgi:hypothetical protein